MLSLRRSDCYCKLRSVVHVQLRASISGIALSSTDSRISNFKYTPIISSTHYNIHSYKRINTVMAQLHSTAADTTNNPLLTFLDNDLPRFDEIQATDVVPAMQTLLDKLTQQFNTYEQNVDKHIKNHTLNYDIVVRPLEDILDQLQLTYGCIKHLSSVADSDELREAIKKVEPDKIKFSLRVAQSEIIYNAMNTLYNEQKQQLTPVQHRVLQLQLIEAKQTGVGLTGNDKVKFNQISERLSELSRTFNNNISDAVKQWRLDVPVSDQAQLDGVSEDTLTAALETARTTEPKMDDTYRFTLSQPVYIAFMNTCKNRSLREHMYRAYVSKASSGQLDNRPIMAEILYLQTQLAKLLGYKNYAEISLETKLVKSVNEVVAFLDELRTACYDKAVTDMSELQQFAVEFDTSAPTHLEHWDINYYVYHMKQQKYDLPEETLKQYLQFPVVKQALFNLLNKLFSVRIVKSDKSIPTWCNDVEYYEVFDSHNNQQLAAFYVDAFARSHNKKQGAWFAETVSRRVANGTTRLPVGYLICNQPAPVGGKPSLMLWRDVETLFHEMGHTLQHLLTTVNENSVAGIRGVEWDAVELPSQFMENWCYDNKVIDDMTRHVDTNQPLPVELRTALLAAKQYRAASDALRQLHFGLTDIKIFSQLLSSSDVDINHTPTAVELNQLAQRMVAVELQQAKTTMLLPPIQEHYFLCSFSHIFAGGYTAGYWSYKAAERMSADAFAAFEEAGLNNETAIQQTGARYRNTILSKGGSESAIDIYKEFRGREPTIDALLRHAGLVAA